MKYFASISFSAMIAIIFFAVSPVHAQSTNAVAKAFAGQWITYDNRHAAQGSCLLTFSATSNGSFYPISPSNCINAMATIRGWTLRNNQLVFIDDKNEPVAAVGGNQERISGTILKGKIPIIVEKTDVAAPVSKARKGIRCSYVGYGQTCAKPRQFAPPTIGANATADIKTLVNLNLRVEPRNNATVKTVLKPNSCLKADFCTLASDGLWCRVQVGDISGWVKKQAVRQKQWPIITFVNGC